MPLNLTVLTPPLPMGVVIPSMKYGFTVKGTMISPLRKLLFCFPLFLCVSPCLLLWHFTFEHFHFRETRPAWDDLAWRLAFLRWICDSFLHWWKWAWMAVCKTSWLPECGSKFSCYCCCGLFGCLALPRRLDKRKLIFVRHAIVKIFTPWREIKKE